MSPRLKFFFVSAIILCLALWLRVVNLYGIPLFVDEGIHLDWAHRFAINAPQYPILMDGKPLLIAWLVLLKTLGPGQLWIGRAAVALASLITCAACIAIGTSLSSRKTGLLAGLIYAFLPQAVFFERQVIADPIMAIFGTLTIFFTLQLAKKQNAVGIIMLALSLAAAVMGKLFGAMYYAVPFFALLLIPIHKKIDRIKLSGYYIASGFLSAILIALFIFALGNKIGVNDQQMASGQVGFLSCPPLICKGDLRLEIEYLASALRSLLELVPPYFGWLVVIVACLALPLSNERTRAPIRFLALCSLAMSLTFIAISKDIPPRYMSFIAAQIVILAAHGWVMMMDRFGRSALTRAAITVLPTLLITFQPVGNVIALTHNIAQAQLANLDSQGYLTNDASGGGVRKAALAMLNAEKESPLPPVIITDNVSLVLIAAQVDRSQIDVRVSGETSSGDIARWLMGGQHIYLIDQVISNTPPKDFIDGLITKEVGRYPRMAGAREVRLRQVVDTSAKFRHAFFQNHFAQPEKLAGNYQALIKTLPDETTVMLYPPQQRAMFGDRKDVYAIGDSWTLDNVSESLKTITASKQNLKIVFLDDVKGDPNKLIETWLNTNLFKVDEQWFGAIRMIGYAGDSTVTQTHPVGARFGDGIRLEKVEVIDSVARRGEVLRLRLIWKAESAVGRDFKSFTHIFIDDKIVAQRDGQPVGELRPTTTWKAGETIRDQFAIRIPNDAPSGVYQLRIGLYDLTTLERLAVNGGEFIVLGEITIQ
ncbi:MAG: glycosyltransferase family 39 protein [Chloroflexota bacterium]